MRPSKRLPDQLRNIRITRRYTRHAEGAVLIEAGDTKVLCTVSVEDKVPPFLKGKGQGWLTAEYGMLPRATNTRSDREAARGKQSGRTQEIQRLIGRALRAVVDLNALGERTMQIDCDVIQADGGTRTASITGAYAALEIAVKRLLRIGRLHNNPLIDSVAAVSIGLRNDELLVDLNYEEDSKADLDMNVVMTQSGKILEIQGTAERSAFTKNDVVRIIEAAQDVIMPIFDLQHHAADGHTAES